MQAVHVDFGTATFSHVKAGLELEVAAEATLQTSHPKICQMVGLSSVDAADLLLLDLWTRPRRPLCVSLAICTGSAASCSFHERLDFRKEVESALGSSVFWSQLGFEVVNTSCVSRTRLPDQAVCTEFTVEVDRTSNPTEHDPNDINCPESLPTARLTQITLRLGLKELEAPPCRAKQTNATVLIVLVDTALRRLICRRPPRLAAGVRRGPSFNSTLQEVFPPIFCPLYSKAISDRLHLISSISRSISNCGFVAKRLPPLSSKFELIHTQGPKQLHQGDESLCRDTHTWEKVENVSQDTTRCHRCHAEMQKGCVAPAEDFGLEGYLCRHCRSPTQGEVLRSMPGEQMPSEEAARGHEVQTLHNSLFMNLVQRIKSRCPSLKPLTSHITHYSLSAGLNELPDTTEGLCLFENLTQSVATSSLSLFVFDAEVEDPKKGIRESPNSLNPEPKVTDEVTASSTIAPRKTPFFEDIILLQPDDGTLLEDCDVAGHLGSRRWSEALFTFDSLSKAADQEPMMELDADILMLRETAAWAHNSAVFLSSEISAWHDLIGEDGELTQSSTRNSPPDDCVQTRYLDTSSHALTTSAVAGFDKGSLNSFPENLFAIPPQQHLPQRLATIESPTGTASSKEVDQTTSALFDLTSTNDFILDELKAPMNLHRDQEPSLADLLGEDKFSRDMWNRRRSTVMDSISTNYSASPGRSIGPGWNLKAPSRQSQHMPTLPTASHNRDARRDQSAQADRRPAFSKRSSVSSSSSASQTPTEPGPQRRDSMLKRWSRGSKSSDQTMLDFDLSNVDQRAVEVKQRKTIEDYEMQDSIGDGEDDDMLFT